MSTIAISGRGECTDLTVELPVSGDEGLEDSHELISLLASYSVDISLWEGVQVLKELNLRLLLIFHLYISLWEDVLVLQELWSLLACSWSDWPEIS